jgi:TRAP-type C4-dicarboxylate transport system substrate-binding protein
VNPDWYNKLPEDLKHIFDASARAAMIYSDTIWLNSENNYLNFLKSKLETNMLTPEATAKFAEAAKPV